MIKLAGGDPVTTSDPAVFSIPLEQLVAADPEVIVLGDAQLRRLPGRRRWPGPAGRASRRSEEGAIRPVDDIVVTRPGPRLADGLASLARAIHPDLVLAARAGRVRAAALPPRPSGGSRPVT